jgi:hypothetical protein
MTALMQFGPSTTLADALISERAPVLFDTTLAFKTPQLQKVLELWRERRGQRLMPRRSDFDMRSLAPSLRQTCFLDIVQNDASTRFYVRLMGSALDQHLMPMTGKFIDEAVPSYFVERWSALYQRTIDSRTPVRVVSRTEFKDQLSTIAEGFFSALSKGGSQPDEIMCVIFHYASDVRCARGIQIYRDLEAELSATFGPSSAVTSKA